MMLKKMENNVGGQNASLLDAVGDGEAARQRAIVLHRTLLTFMELVEDGEKFGGSKDFSQSITADSIKGLQIYACLTVHIQTAPTETWLRQVTCHDSLSKTILHSIFMGG